MFLISGKSVIKEHIKESSQAQRRFIPALKMKIIRGQLCILFIIYLCHLSYAIDIAYDTGKEIWKLYSIIDKITSNTDHDGDGLFGDNTPINPEIRNQMNQIQKKLDEMDKSMGRKIVHDSFQSWTSNVVIYKSMDTLELFVSSVDEYFNLFLQRINQTNYHSDTLQEVIESILSHIVDSVVVIRRNVIDACQLLLTQKNLYSRDFCNGPQIISNTLVRLFRMVIVTEMKAHAMFAIARIYSLPESVVGWVTIITRDQFERQFGTYVNIFALNIKLAETVYLRACDPAGARWIRDKSFYELEGTFQTAIFGYNWMTCKQDGCNEVWLKKAHKCNAGYYDTRSRCEAALTGCAWLHAIQACVLNSGPHKFRYINSTKLGLLGIASQCTNDVGYIIEEGMSSDLSHASCICNCNGNHNKISLLMMGSNVKSNKVITGLRFVRQNQILYIQPRQGKLNAGGYIHPNSDRWVPIPKDMQPSQVFAVDRAQRAFFLDDLQLPAGFVLTGVKFNELIRGTVMGFAIEIYGVPFDYKTGKLNSDEQSMVSSLAPNENPGQPLSFEARSSVFTTKPHIVSPRDTKYVLLERSDLQDDVGQSTLPLFDAVPIYSNPSSALGGIGIFHKGVEGFAGFISLRVYGIRYAQSFTDFESNHMENGRVLFNHSQCCL